MRNHTRSIRRATGIAMAAGALLVAAPSAEAADLFGITKTGELAKFKSNSPSNVNTNVITGLPDGVSIVGMDQRPANGALYGIGSNSTVYRISRQGMSTAVGNGFANPQLDPVSTGAALEGGSFGVDFNPTSDAIRIVSNSGQSLRVSPVTGDLISEDGDINGADARLVGAAYTNSRQSDDLAATTELYVLDSLQDRIYTQDPPNDGTLIQPVQLDIDITNRVGFDLVGSGRKGFIANSRGTITSLFKVNGESGSVGLDGNVKRLGRVGSGSKLVALAVDQPGG